MHAAQVVHWKSASGETAVFSSIESNEFDDYYEMFTGTQGTLILKGEAEAFLFHEGKAGGPTTVDVALKGPGPVLEASESRRADAAGSAGSRAAATDRADRLSPYRLEMAAFCSAVRVGTSRRSRTGRRGRTDPSENPTRARHLARWQGGRARRSCGADRRASPTMPACERPARGAKNF